MKKTWLILSTMVLVLGFVASSWAFYMDFEEGLGKDLQNIAGIPGVTFTDSGGLPWVYGDSTTGNWNTRSIDLGYGSGAYQHYGNVFGWLNVTGNWGRIDFDDKNGTWFQTGVTVNGVFTLEAYDAGGALLDTAYLASANIWEADMAWLRVDAPSGSTIAYVILHDAGNYWLVDNMTGDMAGGVPEPGTLLLLGFGLIGLAGLRRKFRK